MHNVDIYTKLYNKLELIGLPDNYMGYDINYYKAQPTPQGEDEIPDIHQAEIIIPDNYGIIDKLSQMRMLHDSVRIKTLFD